MPDNADRSYLVVVGSSASGIDALSTLVATLPTPFPAALVIAQHLDPHHESHLADIRARSSALPIRSATTGTPLEPGIVYVVPANQHVEIQDGILVLSAAGTLLEEVSDSELQTACRLANELIPRLENWHQCDQFITQPCVFTLAQRKHWVVWRAGGAAGAKPMLTPATSGYQFSSSSASENFSRRWR